LGGSGPPAAIAAAEALTVGSARVPLNGARAKDRDSTPHAIASSSGASARALPVLPSDAVGASVAAGFQGPHPCNPVLRQPAVPELSAARPHRSPKAATSFSSEQ
jgi:hypothetical protein